MTYFFAEFEVDDAELLCFVKGEQIQLEPKVLRLLIYLLENPNRLVRKQELLDALWPAATVTENALTRAVGLLRKALGEDGQNPRFLHTVPTAGYRFSAEIRTRSAHESRVSLPTTDPSVVLPPVARVSSTSTDAPRPNPRRWKLVVAVAALIITAAVGLLMSLRLRKHVSQQPAAQTSTATSASSQAQPKAEDNNRLAAVQARNPAAYDAYVKGRFLFFNEISHGDDLQYAEATREVETAARLDPQFAEPFALLAQILERSVHHGRGNVSAEFAQSYLLANKAIALDPRCSLAHVVLGELHSDKEGDLRWEAAVSELKVALDLNPADAFAHGLLGEIYVKTGLLDRAVEEADIANHLDPSFNNYTGVKIRALEFQQRFQEASDLCVSLASKSQCSLLLWESGQHDDAWTALQSGLKNPAEKSSLSYVVPTSEAFLLAKKGKRREADQVIQSILKTVNRKSDTFFAFSEYYLGVAYAVMDDETKAIDLLEQASLSGFPCYPMYANDPELAQLRKNSRFVALLERLRRQNDVFHKTL